MSFKTLIKDSLLEVGLYHKVNNFRFRDDERNRAQEKFYAKVINKTDLVFDVGANIGQRAEIYAKLANKVVAIEPQPNCLRHLKSRFKFNRQVVIEAIALADKPGEAKMWQSDSPGISSMSRRFIDTMGQSVFRNEHWDKEITVPTRTLDELIEKHGLPNFMKLDVEGFEITVLRGLTKAIPFLSFEYTPEMIDEAQACLARVNEISGDYQYNYCLGEDLEFVLPAHLDYADFVEHVEKVISHLDTFGDVYAVLKR